MSIFHLLSDLRGPWLIDRASAEPFLPMIFSLLAGEKTPEAESYYRRVVDVKTKDGYVDSMGVAVHTIDGPLYKWRTAWKAENFQLAEEDEAVMAHVLEMDTPGGSVTGLEGFAKKVANAKKPVIVHVANTLASGGFWLAAPAQHIMISGETNVIGSIGTMLRLENMDGLLAKLGIKVHEVYAKDSKDKNRLVKELLKGNDKPIQKEFLDPTNDVFVNWVTKHRGKKLDLEKENVLTGNIYLGKQAIAVGLADSMGTLDEAVALAAKTAQSRKTKESMSFLSNFFKTAQQKAQEEGKEVSQEELNQQAEAEVDRLAKENADLQTRLDELEKASKQEEKKEEGKENDRLAAIEATLQQLTEANNQLAKEKQELEEENKKLGEQQGGTASGNQQTDRFDDTKQKIPLLDVEKKAAEQGAKIDHSTFERIKGVTIF